MSTQTIIENAIDWLRDAAFETNDERKLAEYQNAADDLEDALHDVQKQKEALTALVDAYNNGAAKGGNIDWADVDLAHELACEALGIEKASKACARCGSPLDEEGYCTDETCPFSDYMQDDKRGWAGHPGKEDDDA